MTPFTPEQVAFIERIVDARIASTKPKKAQPSKSYHSVPEIRLLIANNMQELRDWFGAREFDITSLRDFLARKVSLREDDDKPVGKGGITRWEHQVSNAIDLINWQDCPIVSCARRGKYRLTSPEIHPTLLIAPF